MGKLFRRRHILLLAAGIGLAAAGTAFGYWLVSVVYGNGNYAMAQADTLPIGATPVASQTVNGSTTVYLDFSTAGTTTGGQALSTYTIREFLNGATTSTASASCTPPSGSHTCTVTPPSDGSWAFTDTPVYGPWSGGRSGKSNSVSVDTTPPVVQSTTIAGSGAAADGIVRAGGTYHVYANVSDAVSGVQSVVANVANVTTGQTAVALTGTGGPFTSPGGVSYKYRSAQLTANASQPDGSVTYSLNATDVAGNATANSGNGSVSFDSTAPTLTAINTTGTNPTNTGPLSWTVTFSEPVAGVGASNFQVVTGTGIGGSVGAISVTGSGASYTVSVPASHLTGTNTNNAVGLNLLSASGITDPAGNPLATASFTGQSFTYDTTVPTVSSITPAGTNPTNTGPLAWTVTFSEPVTGVTAADFSTTKGSGITGASLGAPARTGGSGTTWTLSVATTGVTGANSNNTIGLNLASGSGISDAAGNLMAGNASFTGQTYTYDTTAPSLLSINRASGPSNPTNTGPLTWTVTFSETVRGLSASNLATVPGSGITGTLGTPVVTGSGTTWTVSSATTGVAGDNTNNTVGLNLVNGTGITDPAGNASATTTFTGQAWTYDTTAPVLQSLNRTAASPAKAGPLTWSATFSESVTGVTASNFSVSAGGGITPGPGTISVSGSGSAYTVSVSMFKVTGANTDNSVTLALANGTGISDAAGNSSGTTSLTGQSYVYDTTQPNLLTMTATGTNPTHSGPLTWAVTFDEPVIGVSAGNFTATKGTGIGGTLGTPQVTGSGTSWTVSVATAGVTGGNTNNSVGLNLANNTGITDLATNGLTNNSFPGQTYTYDTTAPTAGTISTAAASPTNTSSLTWTVSFSEPVTGVSPANFTVWHDSGVSGTLGSPTPSCTGSSCSVVVSMMAVTGANTANSVRLDLTSGSGITDAAGNGLATANLPLQGQVYAYDTTAPTLSSINISGTSPTNASSTTLAWTVTFPEPVVGVSASNFQVDAGTGIGTGLGAPVVGGSGASWTVSVSSRNVTGANTNNTIGIDLVSTAGVTDQAGNYLTAASLPVLGQTYTYDTTAPAVSSISTAGTNPTNTGPLTWTVTFSEPVTGVNAGDFTAVKGTGISGTLGTPQVGGSGATWTVSVATSGLTATPAAGGSVGLNLSSGSGISDLAANSMANSTSLTGQTYTYDITAPTMSSINRAATATNPTNTGPLTWTVTFSEPVTGVSAANFAVTAGTGITGTPGAPQVGGSGNTWTVSVTTTGVTGANTNNAIGLNLANGTGIADLAGNGMGSGATFTTGQTFTYDTTAPTVQSAALGNGGTSGKVDKGDTVTLVFSEPLDASKICSSWVNGSVQSLTSGNDVTVTVTDTAGSEVLTVTSSSCPSLNVGVVGLGAQYLSANSKAVFTGSGGSGGSNASKVTWTPSTATLLITLGAMTSGTVNSSVAAGLPSYLPPAGTPLADLAGNALASTTFTSTSATRF